MHTIEKIMAKSKLDALKKCGYEYIYWKGNNPYSIQYGIYTYKIYAIKIEYGKYMISAERIN